MVQVTQELLEHEVIRLREVVDRLSRTPTRVVADDVEQLTLTPTGCVVVTIDLVRRARDRVSRLLAKDEGGGAFNEAKRDREVLDGLLEVLGGEVST